jgi:intein/homing endonuclease
MKSKNLDIIKITELYNSGLNGPQIAKLYNVCKKTITNLLLKNGIKLRNRSDLNRKYKLNESYFSTIDTQDKAYILGILYADGCILEKSKTIKISLKESDNHILKKISSLIYIDYRPLDREICKNSYSNNTIINTLRICSLIMYVDLLVHGLTPRKSLTLEFPKTIPNNLMSHFLRGYLDGDGWISVTTRKYKGNPSTKRIRCGFLCSKEFSVELINFLNNLNVKSSIVIDHRCSQIYDVRITSNKSSKILLDFIYKDATIYLQRKYSKYKEMFG